MIRSGTLLLLAILCLFHLNANAQDDTPYTFSFDGIIIDEVTGNPLDSNNVTFIFRIYGDGGSCLLYEEQQLNIDISDPNNLGVFSLQIGDSTGGPKRTGGDPGLTMGRIFANNPGMGAGGAIAATIGGTGCVSGYVPGPGSIRMLEVEFIDVANAGGNEVLPMFAINSVPSAFVAQSLQGKYPTDFVQQTDSAAGDITGDFTNLSIQKIQGKDVLAPSPVDGQVLKWVGANNRWEPAADNDSAGGENNDGANVGTGDGQVYRDKTAPTLNFKTLMDGTGIDVVNNTDDISFNLTTSGVTAGTYPKVTVDAYGRATVGFSTLSGSDIGAAQIGDGHISGVDVSKISSATGSSYFTYAPGGTACGAAGEVLEWDGAKWICGTITGEANDVTDMGTGTGTLRVGKSGSNIQLRSLFAGTGITVANNGNNIDIGIANLGVGPSQLAANSVTTAKIADGNVTTAKIADGNVSDVKISDVNVGKVQSGAGQYFTYMPNGAVGECLDGEVLKWSALDRWECASDDTGAAGEANDGANVGAGDGKIYRDKSTNIINFKTLVDGTGLDVVDGPDDITFNVNVGTGANQIPMRDALGNLDLGSTGDLVVDTNLIFVDVSADNVGIGQGVPTARLHVTDSLSEVLRIESTAANARLVMKTASNPNNTGISVNNTGGLALNVNAQEILRVNEAPNEVAMNGDVKLADYSFTILSGASEKFVANQSGQVAINHNQIRYGSNLDVNGKIVATDICDEFGSCHDITNLSSSTGTVTSVNVNSPLEIQAGTSSVNPTIGIDSASNLSAIDGLGIPAAGEYLGGDGSAIVKRTSSQVLVDIGAMGQTGNYTKTSGSLNMASGDININAGNLLMQDGTLSVINQASPSVADFSSSSLQANIKLASGSSNINNRISMNNLNQFRFTDGTNTPLILDIDDGLINVVGQFTVLRNGAFEAARFETDQTAAFITLKSNLSDPHRMVVTDANTLIFNSATTTNDVVTMDMANDRVGIMTAGAPLATLQVDGEPLPPAFFTEDFEGGGTGVGFTVGGDVVFSNSVTAFFSGSQSVESGSIGINQVSWIERSFTMAGPGKILFHARVDAENCCDYLEIYLDGVFVKDIRSGPWAQHEISIPSGTHTVRWQFIKDGSVTVGADKAWVDLVEAIDGAPPAMAVMGDLGVGTTFPTERLHVVGNLRVQGSTDCTLGNGSGSTMCSSDARLKDNVEVISGSMDKINLLRGVEFDWNEKSVAPGKHSIGVIAQDVREVFPTAVTMNSNGYLAVDYAVLVSPLIEATKEVNKKCEATKEQLAKMDLIHEEIHRSISSIKDELSAKDRRIRELESQVQNLESRLQKIEERLSK